MQRVATLTSAASLAPPTFSTDMTDMTKLIVAFCKFASAPKNVGVELWWNPTQVSTYPVAFLPLQRETCPICLPVRLLPSLNVWKNSRISNRIVLRFYNEVFNYFNSENIDLHVICRLTCVSAATSSNIKGKALPVQD